MLSAVGLRGSIGRLLSVQTRCIFSVYNDELKIAQSGKENRKNANFIPPTPKTSATVVICRGLEKPRYFYI